MTFLFGWFGFRRHPSERLLVACHDGEVGDKARVRLRKHLRDCSECGAKAALIENEWSRLSLLNKATRTDIAEDRLMENIRASIRMFGGNESVQQRMEEALGVYLGKRAAAAVLKGSVGAEAPAQGSLDAVDTVLRVLLGKKSAEAIEARLIKIRDSSAS